MKSNSTRILPARRTIRSIVRQTTEQLKEKVQSNPTTPSSTTANTTKSGGNNSGIKNNNNPICDICAQNVPGPEREKIYASGKCDHPVCYVCSARLRAICDQQECPICREKLDRVIFSANKTKHFDSYDLQSYRYDEKYRIYFETDKIREAFENLLNIECLECMKRTETSNLCSKNDDKKRQVEDPDLKKLDTITTSTSTNLAHDKTHRRQFQNVQKLRNHMFSAHKLKLCDLCLQHNKLFPFEYSYYSPEALKRHIQDGELNTSHRGHPRCELCSNIFFNLDELLQHMSREHFHCHLCGRHNTTSHIYFIDYQSLRHHFKTKHILCERDNCRHEQFTSAFDTQVDYQLHLVQVHDTSRNLTRGEARQHRTITLETASHRQSLNDRQERIPANAAIVHTGLRATANDPRRQIPESLQAQIIQQRLPSRADFPALSNVPISSTANVQDVSQQVSGSQQRSLSEGAGPSHSRISFVRSVGGYGRPPEALNEMDFPPLPEQPVKNKSTNKSKGTANKPRPTPSRPEQMTLDQLISSSLTLSARGNRRDGKAKTSKNTKPRPIKILL